MGEVIHIRFSEDLGSQKKNELRYRMELAEWKKRWREAVDLQDYEWMDRLDREYQKVGLP